MHRVLLKFLYQDNLRVTLNTDGDGVMGTTIEREYEIAQEAIDDFKSGKTPLIDEKGMTIYYYDREQIPDFESRDEDYDYVAIPESKKGNFSVERLEQESDRYIDEIAPTLGSAEQREEALEIIEKQKEENQNNTVNEETIKKEEN